jgi:transposase
MRFTTVAKKLLGVIQLFVLGARFEEDGLVLRVRPAWHKPRCGVCGRRAPGYDQEPLRRWRWLPIGRARVYLEYALRRVWCPNCQVRTEAVPWAEQGSWFTKDFEEMVAYLAQTTDRTTVCKTMGMSWRAVGGIIERVVGARLDPSRLDGLKRIGIDEFSYRKRHRYLTVVVDHDSRRVVWAAEGRGSATLKAFFEALGPERLSKLETVSMDMAAGYIKAFEEEAPWVQIVFDRFHVQRLASDAVDDVRREQWRELQGTEEGDAVKDSRYALLKNPWNLTCDERHKLSEVQRDNARLYRAYLLKETLAKALDYLQPKRASEALDAWLAWASRSRLAPFVKAARTIRKYKQRILAYISHRLTNGIVEGFNNKVRTVARRAYGFHTARSLIAMLFLCCGGISLDPPIPGGRDSPT